MTGIYGQAPWANVFWVRNGGLTTPSSSALDALAKFVYDTWVSQFGDKLAAGNKVEGCQVNYYGAGGDQLGGGWVQNTDVGGGGTTVPASMSCCISWHVAQRYRGGHPRTYLPPADGTQLASTTLFKATYVESVRLAANAFLLNINAFESGVFTGSHLGTVSFQLRKEWRNPPVFRDYTPGATAVDTRIDSQRRRLGVDR